MPPSGFGSCGKDAGLIFDTDVLIWFFRGNARAAREIERTPERLVSAISVMELYQGARSKDELRTILQFLQHHEFRVLPVNEAISHSAVGLMEDHALRDGLHVADALIAATARHTKAALLTGNVRHFRKIPRIEVRTFQANGGGT